MVIEKAPAASVLDVARTRRGPTGHTPSSRPRRFVMRCFIRTVLVVAPVAMLPGLPEIARGQCIDYRDYLHGVNRIDLPGKAWDVAVSGGYAFVAAGSGDLLVADLSVPNHPVIGSYGTRRNSIGTEYEERASST